MVRSVGAVGGVNSPNAATLDTAPPVGGGAVSGTVTNAALYQTLSSPLVATGPLGLSAPGNPEDAGAILAEAELLLDQTTAQTTKSRIENAFGGTRNALGSFAGFVSGVQAGVATDRAKTADDARLAADLTEQQNELQLQADAAGQAATALQSARATLGADAPGSGKTVDGATYVANLQAAQSGLQSSVSAIQGQVDAAKAQALQAQQASLNGQIAAVDGQIATAQAEGDTDALARLATTRSALEAELTGLPAALDAAYAAVFQAATAQLQAGISTLQGAIDAASQSSAKNKTYSASDYASLSSALDADRSAASSAQSQASSAAGTIAGQLAAVTADVASLTADIAVQVHSLVGREAALLPAFSQLATDIFGPGAHSRDVAKSALLDRGFENLDDAARKLREDETDRAAQDGRIQDKRQADLDAARVAALVLGLVAGLEDLRSVLKQESEAPPRQSPDQEIPGADNRYRLSL